MMDLPTALLTLIHVLIFVYWLGGDLGAFYSSNFLVDPKRTVIERRMALKILNNVDMAPRTALILAFPTGLALAWAKGWLQLSGLVPLVVGIAGIAWLALAWAVHLNHNGGTGLKRLDMGIRYAMLCALIGLGVCGVSGDVAMPLFIALKMIILGLCICLGLVVRKQIVPMFVAFAEMVANGATPETDAAISGANGRARVSVLTLWALLLAAAFLGIWTPV